MCLKVENFFKFATENTAAALKSPIEATYLIKYLRLLMAEKTDLNQLRRIPAKKETQLI